MMGRPICSYQTCSVQTQGYWQLLQANIMNYLIIGSLSKGRIQSHHRMGACCSHPSCHGYCIFFSNTHIKKPFWELLGKGL